MDAPSFTFANVLQGTPTTGVCDMKIDTTLTVVDFVKLQLSNCILLIQGSEVSSSKTQKYTKALQDCLKAFRSIKKMYAND